MITLKNYFFYYDFIFDVGEILNTIELPTYAEEDMYSNHCCGKFTFFMNKNSCGKSTK